MLFQKHTIQFFTTTFLVYHVVQAHHYHLIDDTIPTFFIIRVSFYCLYTSFIITKNNGI